MTRSRISLAGLALVAVIGAFVAVSAAPQAQPKPELALKAAMDKEVLDGDLKTAIGMYQKLTSSSDRAVAAKALLRMGQCYEKLGDANAREAYETVVAMYPEQKESVADAQKFLTGLVGSATAEPVRRRVWVLPAGRRLIGDVSPTGRYVAFTVLRDGNGTGSSTDGSLWVHDVPNDRDHNIAPPQPGQSVGLRGLSMLTVAFSPDGRQLAYGADSGNGFELRVADMERVSTKAMWREPVGATGPVITQVFWLDERHIAVRTIRTNLTLVSNVVISVPDGAAENRPLDGDGLALPSPDGRSRIMTTRQGILLGQASGSSAMLFPRNAPTQDSDPKWSADGRHLLFWSNRAGSGGWWAFRIVDGKPEGDAVEIKGPTTSLDLVGSTRDGSLFYTEVTQSKNVYEVALEPATGRVVSAPRRFNAGFVGAVAGSSPVSPNGQFVAYMVGEGSPVGYSGGSSLVVRSLQTGDERRVSLGSIKARNVWQWFPDNRSVIVDDQSADRMAWRRVEVATGSSTLLFEQLRRDTPAAAVELTPDGNSVFLTLQGPAGWNLLRRNLATGEQTVVFDSQGEDTLWPAKRISPDGLQIAFGSHSKDSYIVRTMSVNGGPAREVYRSTQETNLLGWTRDGRHLFLAQTDPTSHLQELLSLPSDGGPPVRVGLTMGRLHWVSTMLDGRLLVNGLTMQTEIWAATNLLSGTRK